MGLNQSQNESLVFLAIANGKIVRQFKDKTEKSVSRVNKMGREVHEEFYDSLTGILKDVSTKESEYGKFWVVKMESEGKLYQIEMNYSGGYAASFLKTIPNADLTKEFTLTPKLTIDGDKKKSVIFINQGGLGLKWFFTRDNPNGMPELAKIKVKGKDTWDDSDRMEFLENYVKSNILPKLNNKSSQVQEDEDEIPF
tara:strand:+ start:70 stop:660 length:591 start_codon:yes stop_codon:yes gene_type:complete